MTKKEAPKLHANVKAKLAQLTTKSAKIRYLHSAGFERGDIARIMNIRYQHVRNVLITPVKSK